MFLFCFVRLYKKKGGGDSGRRGVNVHRYVGEASLLEMARISDFDFDLFFPV